MVDGLESTVVFNQLKEHLSSTPDIVKKVKAIIMWNITKDGKRVAEWSESIQQGHFINQAILCNMANIISVSLISFGPQWLTTLYQTS